MAARTRLSVTLHVHCLSWVYNTETTVAIRSDLQNLLSVECVVLRLTER